MMNRNANWILRLAFLALLVLGIIGAEETIRAKDSANKSKDNKNTEAPKQDNNAKNQPAKDQPKPPPEENPKANQKTQILFRYFPKLPREDPQHVDLLYEYMQRFLELRSQQEKTNRLRARQNRLNREIRQASSPSSDNKRLSRDQLRQKVMELHSLQKDTDKERNTLNQMADNFSQYSVKKLPELKKIENKWMQEAGIDKNNEEDWKKAPPFLINLASLIDLIEEVKSTPANANELMLRETRQMLFTRSNNLRGSFIYRAFEERINNLERDQKILEHRLDSNRREIDSLKRQLERMGRFRGMSWKRPGLENEEGPEEPSSEKPPPPAGRGDQHPPKHGGPR
ncbi:MAG: hypothetical protein ACLFQ6_11710 [Candidatus Sumerlaeia bacterium]